MAKQKQNKGNKNATANLDEFGGGLVVNLWCLGGEPGEGVGQETLLQDWVEFRKAVVEDFCAA